MNEQTANKQKKSTERKPNGTGQSAVSKLVTLALLSAIGMVLVAILEVPLFAAAPFLKYDPGDIPILIGAMFYGPWAGLAMTFLISFVQSFLIHGSGGPIGFLMHFVATGAMAIVVGLLYKRGRHSIVNMICALIGGSVTMVVIMVLFNLLLTPLFLGPDGFAQVKEILVPVIIPFNVIKAGINSVIAGILAKSLLATGVLKNKG